MNAYLNYIIEANVGLILFLAAYILILRKETDFKIKRGFLLASILFSLTFPLFHIQNNGTSILTLSHVIPSYSTPTFTAISDWESTVSYSPKGLENLWFYLRLIYFFGFSLLLIRFIIQLIKLIRTIRNSKTNTIGKLKIAESTEDMITFSFFNFIFIGKVNTLSNDEKQKIILHESIHANQLHSFDIILLKIIGIFFWINPLLKTYKKIFVQLHEFEADARAVENSDVNEYCQLLARVALRSVDFKLANHFNNSLTLKRIEMMKTIKQNIKPWKLMVIASVIPLTFFMTACQEQLVDGLSTVADETAIPIGGMGAFYEHLLKKLKYPAEARRGSIQGKVFIEFVVNENGSIDVTGISGIGGGCDLEAMQVVQSAPKWIPAKLNGVAIKQRMVLPITFKLDIPGEFQDVEGSDVKAPEGSLGEVVVVGWKDR